MDKRTVIFVLLVGITFFGLNIFFSRGRDEKNRELLKQHEAKIAKEKAATSLEYQKRMAKIQDLPLVDLFLDEKGQAFAAKGILNHNNVLTLAWTENLPKSIYVNGAKKNLMTEFTVKQAPVLYGPIQFDKLEIANVPETGSYDVQLITFPENAAPELFLGVIKNNALETPLGSPTQNALALYKTDKGWLPLGFYAADEEAFVELQKLPLFGEIVKPYVPAKKIIDKKQNFYVLENEYVQLVFSNVGGSLSEINLPFKSEKNPNSVVKEIGFDREIVSKHPSNGRFPAHPFYTADSKTQNLTGKLGGYYPLIRRGIWNQKTFEIAPKYMALNLVSEYPELAELVYEVKEFTPKKIVFEAVQPHRKITKTFSLSDAAPYTFDLTLQIEGDSRGLWLTSGVPEVEIMSNSSNPLIQYRMSRKGKGEVEKLDLPKVKEVVTISSLNPDWVVNSNGYLGIILDPKGDVSGGFRAAAIPGTEVPTRLSVLDPQHPLYPASKYPGYETLLPIASSGGMFHFRIYAGPFEESTLKAVDKIYSDPQTGYNPNYVTCRTFYGWFSFISKPFAELLYIVMKFFYNLTHSWAFAIILLTVFLRILLYPLNAWSIKSMRRMQKLSPQIQEIQKKYKKDPKKAQIEIMALYREKKVNPFTGCVPILIQIPFLIAMFDLLKSSFQLRGASFIPGWIDNLTAPDVLFRWNTPIFFIGNEFHLLPILLGVVMFFQQRLSATGPKDPSKMTDQQRQQKAMSTIMTVVFTVMFYHFPSGLNLYWLSSMLLGILQQWMTNRILDKKDKDEDVIVPEKGKKMIKPS